jgi:integrase
VKATSGSVVVRYYFAPVKGYDSWQVVWRLDKKACKKRFSAEKAAREFAQQKADDLARGLTRTITAQERAAIDRAVSHIKPFNKPLELACAEYAQALKELDGVPLAEAVRYYVDHHKQVVTKKPAEVLPEFLAAKASDGLSKPWIKLLKHNLDDFTELFSQNLPSITAPMINRWLSSLKVGPKARNNARECLAAFVTYCKAHGYLPRKWDVMEDVTALTVRRGAVQIYSVEEMRSIVSKAKPHLLILIGLQAFAGLRHSEVVACQWQDVNLEDGHIVIRDKTKTGRRIAPAPPNLKALLEPWRKDSGPVYRLKSSTVQIARAARDAGVKHIRNAYRHSFISYRLAMIEDKARVALEAGNSPRVIEKHYLKLVTRAQAEKWFSIGL